jgi:hypothetical protein
MGRRKSNDWEAAAKAVVGLLLLAALAGGTKGFAERFNAIVSLVLLVLLGLVAAVVLVILIGWWVRSRKRRLLAPTFSIPSTRRASPSFQNPTAKQAFDPPGSMPQATPVDTNDAHSVAVDWTARLRVLDWYQFEKLMEHAYRRSGYLVERKGGAKADGGVDLILEKDGIRTAVQCKHWRERNVGVRPVREFVGALADHGLNGGILVTLNGFTADAKELAERHRITLLLERDVTAMLLGLDVDYDPELQALLVNPEKCCPKCDSRMELRTAKTGGFEGRQFWGCSRYPRCRSILPFEAGLAGDDQRLAEAWRD